MPQTHVNLLELQIMKLAGTLFIQRSEIESLLTFSDYVSIVENAFRDYAEGRTMRAGLMHVEAEGGEFHIKAGGLKGDPAYFGIKINGGFFQNSKRFGMPNIQGVILLSDGANGYPLCIMDSIEVTMKRTGAATAVAAKYLARPESSICTICGLGNQGRIQLKAIVSTLPIKTVYAWSPVPNEAVTFARYMSEELNIEVFPADDLEAASYGSDVIVTCTPSRKAFLMKGAVRPGTFIAAVGADSPDKQELDPELVMSSKIVGDIIDQIATVGETHHAIEMGLMPREAIHGEIGDIIAKRKVGRTSPEEVIIYDSTGTAVQDVAVAIAVYNSAQRKGIGVRIDLAS
ncbi:MAG TPA: ornithine cyclodeaminase family protein [Acidobacteriaceae bacterium]|nr:ornithine cyclodeaminase family protein [Acidobacteriaceae bacterium]